jgi:hypothetical protein
VIGRPTEAPMAGDSQEQREISGLDAPHC